MEVATTLNKEGRQKYVCEYAGFQKVSEQIFELEQKKAKKKKELDSLEKEIKQLKSETSSYMKKRQKNELTVAGLTVLFTAYMSSRFDKDAFIAGEEDGEATYNKYLKNIPMEKVTVRLAKTQL